MAVYFKGPASFTGEDIVEFHIHGGVINSQKILKLIIKNGAIQAERGEFTERAFLFGKIDLVQAESILDIIEARSENAHLEAVGQLRGELSNHLKEIKERLFNITTITEATIDFPEEDYDFMGNYKIQEKVEHILFDLNKLSSSYYEGKLISKGAIVTIVGAPNAGKSSLMNNLLKMNRALVTSIPGTTRDYLEGEITIKGIPITLIDTAGIRESEDEIERIGVKNVSAKIKESDLIIFLYDENGFTNDIEKIYKEFYDKNHILIQNKIDISKNMELEPNLEISAKNDININELKDLIYNKLIDKDFNRESIIITNERHKQHIDKAIENLENSLESIINQLPLEFISQDFRFSLDEIGAILGEVTPDDILGNIFQNFCIGK
jgi:tRNA modification GTPase